MGMATRTPGITAPQCPTAPSWTPTTTGWETNVMTMMTMTGFQMRNLQALTTVGLSLTLAKKTQMVRGTDTPNPAQTGPP